MNDPLEQAAEERWPRASPGLLMRAERGLDAGNGLAHASRWAARSPGKKTAGEWAGTAMRRAGLPKHREIQDGCDLM